MASTPATPSTEATSSAPAPAGTADDAGTPHTPEAAGQVRGKPFTAWKSEVADLKRAGDNGGAAALLMECIDAAEQIARTSGAAPDVWPTEHAAIVYRKLKDPTAEVAVLERYQAACPDGHGSVKLAERLVKARQLRDKEQAMSEAVVG